ncbi:MAG: DUF11 domain-containing protein, partial [bacterium]|nr:DUF11 domain-containing protein [bacterium]
VTGLPSGASGNFSIDPVTLSSTATSKLTVATGDDTPQGTYLLTITGQGGGVSQQLQVSLNVNPKPDFDLTATPTKREIFPGETTTFQINSEILNQFDGSIQLEVTNLPGHTSGQFLPAAIQAGASSTLTITTTTAAPLGAHALTVTGTSGTLSHTLTLTLKIVEKPLEADFTIAADPDNASVYKGENIDINITLTAVNGFDSEVKLETANLPGGVTALFQPDDLVPDGVSVLTLATTAETPVGPFTLSVTGKGAGKTHSAAITVTVENEPDFLLAAEPTEISVHRGETAEYTVSVTPKNEFAAEVFFSVEGQPEETTVRWFPGSVVAAGQTRLRIVTTEAIAVGSYPLVVTAQGGGKSQTLNLNLIVTCPAFTAAIEAQPETGPAPLAVDLHAALTQQETAPGGGYSFAWDLGDGNSAQTQDVQHTYREPGDYAVNLTVTDPCGQAKTVTQSITVTSFDGSIETSFSKERARPGQTVTLTIKAKNATQQDFQQVAIRCHLPAPLQYIDDDAPVNAGISAGKLEWELAALGKGETLSIRVNVKVPDTAAAATLSTIAYLQHHSIQQPISSNKSHLTIEKVEVLLQKSVDKSEAKPGDSLLYILLLENKSSFALTGLQLKDILSDNLEMVSQQVTGGLAYSNRGNTLYWKGTLQPQQKVEIRLEAKIKANTVSGTIIENKAEVTAVELDTKVESQTVRTSVASEPVPVTNVQFTHKAALTQSEVGRVIRFRVKTVNRSTSPLLQPVLEIHMAQGFSYVAGTAVLAGQRIGEPTGKHTLRWELPVIQAGQTATLTYQAVTGADTARGKNVLRAVLRTSDNSGQNLHYESSAFVNISGSGFIFYCGLEGTVYLDRDSDQFYSMTDTPLQGIEVRLSTGEKAITDSMGMYKFDNLYPGEYAANVNRATLPEKYRAENTVSHIVQLFDGLHDTADFCIKFTKDDEEKTARLEGRVFFDKNRNHVYDGNDPLHSNFEAKLGNIKKTKGKNGKFVFTNLVPGPYTVEISYDGRSFKKEFTLKDGDNHIEFPLPFTGIRILMHGEDSRQ